MYRPLFLRLGFFQRRRCFPAVSAEDATTTDSNDGRREGAMEERASSLPAARRLEADYERARGFAENARSANTRRAYRSDWTDFCDWCAGRDVAALPASTDTVALYVSSRSEDGPRGPLKLSTLRRRLSAISQAHKSAGYESPASTEDEPLHSVWAGLAREKTRRKKKAAPVLIEDLRAVLEAVPRRDEGEEPTLLGLRDRALLLVGWAGALRRSEIAALTTQDVRVGSEGLVLTVRRSKTDQEGEGLAKGLPFGERPSTCPVRAVQTWASTAGVETGPLFRAVDRWENVSSEALSTDGVHRIIKRACARVGLEATLYSGHSLRAGFITQAARAGKPERVIMRHSGHSDLKTLREYIREGSLFRENAVEGVGL